MTAAAAMQGGGAPAPLQITPARKKRERKMDTYINMYQRITDARDRAREETRSRSNLASALVWADISRRHRDDHDVPMAAATIVYAAFDLVEAEKHTTSAPLLRLITTAQAAVEQYREELR